MTYFEYRTFEQGTPYNFYHTEYDIATGDAYTKLKRKLISLGLNCDIVYIDQWTNHYDAIEIYELVIKFESEEDYALFLLAEL